MGGMGFLYLAILASLVRAGLAVLMFTKISRMQLIGSLLAVIHMVAIFLSCRGFNEKLKDHNADDIDNSMQRKVSVKRTLIWL